MKPLIISSEKNSFELTRLRNDLKGALELNDHNYSVSIYDETYTIAHFLSLNELRKYKSELIKGAKIILSLLYCEEDYEGSILSTKKDGTLMISKFDLDLINKTDLVLVPNEENLNNLIKIGVTARIKVLGSGVNISKFSVKNTYTRNIAYRYFKCSEDNQFVITILNFSDEKAFERINKIAQKFPKIKFVAITDLEYITRRIKKVIKKHPQNLIISGIVDENVYLSLVFNSVAYLFLNSYESNVMQCYEAMASQTQILALKGSVYSDIIIDKENGYVYNDLDSLISDFSKLISNDLLLTTSKAKEIAATNSLKNVGQKLINIYKGL